MKWYCLSEQVLDWPTSRSMDYCDSRVCNVMVLFLSVRSKKNESSECSVNLDCSDVPITLKLNVDAESHEFSNEVVSERLSRYVEMNVQFSSWFKKHKN